MWTFESPWTMFRSPGDCDLELLDFEEDRDVGVEVARRVGRVGPVRMGFDPGRDLVGVDDGDLLDLLAQDLEPARGARRVPATGYSASAPEVTLHRMTTFFPSSDGPFGSIVGFERLEEIGQRPRVAAADRDQAAPATSNDGGDPHLRAEIEGSSFPPSFLG